MQRSVVVQHHPHRRRRLLLLALLVVALAFIAGFFLAGYKSLQLSQTLQSENQGLQERMQVQQRELEQLQQWRENQLTREEVDATALGIVRQELAEQQGLIAELERGMRFYKGLMSPGENDEQVTVRGIDLIAGAEAGRYQFRILVQQRARKHEVLEGTLRVELGGSLGSEEVSYDLSTLSANLPKQDMRLRFKYFQAIDGELEIPQGFVPRKMIAYAKITKPRPQELKHEFPWSVQERFTNVGQ